jgi:hypothetical protein
MEPKSGSISRHDHARIHTRMAKTENPADSSNADSSRVALDRRALNFPAKGGLPPGVPPADLFDAGTGGFGAKPGDPQRSRSLAASGHGDARYGGVSGFSRQGMGGQSAGLQARDAGAAAGPGPVRARDRRAVDELPFVDEEDVIEEEAPGHEAPEDARFGAPRESDYGAPRESDYGASRESDYGAPRESDYGVPRDVYGRGHDDHARARAEPNVRRAELAARQPDHAPWRQSPPAKLPIANLEPPSGPRLDLTPSPVPRVALAPATGSVDISLVPGPHDHMGGGHFGGGQSWGSRNLPTLAAQHLIGGKQRRPAPAATVPPPGELPRQEQLASRDRRLRSGIAKDVRSSKREIVLGLMIGLGLSMLLAAIGQAYLQEERPVAGAQEQPELESLTLSARPEVSPAPSAVAVESGTPSVVAPGEAAPAAHGIEGLPGSPVAHAPAPPMRLLQARLYRWPRPCSVLPMWQAVQTR